MCLFDELCALHVSSVTLLAHSVQLQLLLLRMSECGLRSTATTGHWFSYGERKSASVWHVCVRACVRACVHACVHMCVCVRVHACLCVCVCACVCVRVGTPSRFHCHCSFPRNVE